MPGRKIPRLPRDQSRLINNEVVQGRHIPHVLLDHVSSLRDLSYAKQLSEFSSRYRSQTFDLDKEYNYVYNFCYDLLTSTQGKPIADALQVSKRLELMMQNQDWEYEYRDHFIHSFQDFLLGAVILEHNYKEFKKWYSDRLCKDPRTSVDASWLLASIFHDRTRPLEQRDWLGEEQGVSIKVTIDLEDEYLRNLASLYEHLRTGKKPHKWYWRYGSFRSFNKECYDVLAKYSKQQNHGVLSAMTLLKRVSQTYSGVIPPHSAVAALAIATHDRKPRNDFLDMGVLPLRIDKFPISCLLLYCDAAQEWGRPHSGASDETRLSRIDLGLNSVHCDVSFVESKRAIDKLKECTSVRKCIQSSRLRLSLGSCVMMAQP